MINREVATIPFSDGDSGGNAMAIVRQCGDRIALCVSIEEGGDIEVLIDVATTERLIDALKRGVDQIMKIL
jgi:hypothetical protein